MIMIKKLIQFILRYLSDESFRQLCDSALKFSKSIDTHLGLFGANIEQRSPQWNKVRNQHLKEQSTCQVCGSNEDLSLPRTMRKILFTHKSTDQSRKGSLGGSSYTLPSPLSTDSRNGVSTNPGQNTPKFTPSRMCSIRSPS